MSDHKVIVLGGGLAGLGFKRAFPEAVVFEAKKHPGGHAYSHPINGFHWDEGAHISHTKDLEFLQLICSQAKSVNQLYPSKVINYWHGLWLTYPVQNYLRELPLNKRLNALKDLIASHLLCNLKAAKDYEMWCRFQYGNWLTDYFYDEFTRKYWRTEMKDLSTDWLGGRLIPALLPNIIKGAFTSHSNKQASFTKFHYPNEGGFFGFFKNLFDEVEIECNQKAEQINFKNKEILFQSGRKEKYDVLVNSIPLPVLVGLIKEAPSSVVSAALQLRHTKLLCVNMIVSRADLKNCHWCYVYDDDVEAARISFPSRFTSDSKNKPFTAIQAEVFRRNDEPLDAEALQEKVVNQIGKMFNFDPKTDVASVNSVFVPYAYVVSDLNRERSVSHISEWLEKNDIFSMGLYGTWKYMWSDQAFSSGVNTAKRIREKYVK